MTYNLAVSFRPRTFQPPTAAEIRTLREASRLTQEDAAILAGVSMRQWRRYESLTAAVPMPQSVLLAFKRGTQQD
jgi:DNA-binding transcriptional regulator YiaG